ncbi:MAG: VanZ family protein [Lachnospiraceae bacterium]
MNGILDRALKQFGNISISLFLTLTLIMVGIAALFLIAYFVIGKKKLSMINVVALFMLVIYINIILQLTLLGRNSGSRIGVDLSVHRNQWTGSSDISHLIRMYSVLNVLLFVPFGFIISLFTVISEKGIAIRLVVATLITLVASLMIECAQLLTGRGYFELDDLICNTLGGFIGALCAWVALRVGRIICSKDINT